MRFNFLHTIELEQLEKLLQQCVLSELCHRAVDDPISTLLHSELLELDKNTGHDCLPFAVKQCTIDDLEALTLPTLALRGVQLHECLRFQLVLSESKRPHVVMLENVGLEGF